MYTCFKYGLFLICILNFLSSSVYAHYLNMTRSVLEVDTSNRQATYTIRVDFTKLIGSPEAYFELTKKHPEQLATETERLSEALMGGLKIEVNQQAVSPKLHSFSFPDLPIEKFTEPWAAPMAELMYQVSLDANASEVRLRTDPFLEIEFPFVLTLQSNEPGRRPVTRWLEAGQSSPVFGFHLQKAAPSERLVSAASDPVTADPEEGSYKGFFLRYVVLGFEHILPKGFDHILFILGLFFLSHRWKPLLAQASIFTLAHTITLMVSGLDWIVYKPGIVEPLIAASIVYVGVENLFRRQLQRGRLLVVFIFGLIHGMGFANMFLAIELPRTEFFGALLCFNLGVELGQLAVICLAWLLLHRFFDKLFYRKFVQIPGSLLIAGVAAIWFLQRLGGA